MGDEKHKIFDFLYKLKLCIVKYERNRIFSLIGLRERSKEKGLNLVQARGIFCLISQRLLW